MKVTFKSNKTGQDIVAMQIGNRGSDMHELREFCDNGLNYKVSASHALNGTLYHTYEWIQVYVSERDGWLPAQVGEFVAAMTYDEGIPAFVPLSIKQLMEIGKMVRFENDFYVVDGEGNSEFKGVRIEGQNHA